MTNSNSTPSKLLLPILSLAVLSTWLVTIIFQILLIDIAKYYQIQIGTASMAASVGSVSGIIFGLLMAVVSIRFNHKLLLLSGLVCTILGILGYYFAPNFASLLAANIGVGAGIAIVNAMSFSIIGDNYPLKNRGKAVGVIVAAMTFAFVVGSIAVGVIVSFGDWRLAVILLALPFAIASLVLAAFVVPRRPILNVHVNKEPFSIGCKLAFSCLSTVAALLVTMFLLCESAISYYSVSFFRDQFGLSATLGASFNLIANVASAVGGAVAGLMVNRVGRKKLGTITLVISSGLTIMFMFMPTLELSGFIGILRFWFSSMAMTAGGSLILEQLPKFRSTMMSLNTVFMNIGMFVASLIGGFMLNGYGYQALGLVLGSLGIVGTIVWITLVKEPVLQNKNN